MIYKFFVFAPHDTDIILKIIDAATKEGAGIVGNYSHCAFVTQGYGTWLPNQNAKPMIGKIGELSRENEVKIEMECPTEKMKNIFDAVKKVHPYEKIVIDAVLVERFE